MLYKSKLADIFNDKAKFLNLHRNPPNATKNLFINLSAIETVSIRINNMIN